uniref:Alkaline nuclease n=1 Tax=Lutzomyia longipalpis TaxID=7200 RepID=A0A1B0CE89_LUTLO
CKSVVFRGTESGCWVKKIMKVVHFVIVLLHWQLSDARIAISDQYVVNPLMEPCEIRVSGGGLGEPQPLILNRDATEFVEPKDAAGIIRLNPGDVISLFCTNGFATPSTTMDLVRATCTTGNIFTLDSNKMDEVAFSDITCTAYPYHTARKSGKMCGNGAGVDIEVGFIVKGSFIELFHICHDDIIESTMYVEHTMGPGNEGYQRSFPRPSWLSSGFFGGKNADQLYTNVNQKAMVAQILGSQELADKFIQPTATNIYLARGHMAAKVDFIFGAQQRATFWLINVAPQWQKFNAGNWERVESSVRRMVSQRNTNLKLYTGTYGVMTLPDINGEHQEIYLHFDENNNGQIPVPKLYYRVIYEESTKRGIVLIGVNNIHITVDEIEEQGYIICEDVADKINWVNWDRFNLDLGYSYACEVEEFAKVVDHLPKMEISGLFI